MERSKGTIISRTRTLANALKRILFIGTTYFVFFGIPVLVFTSIMLLPEITRKLESISPSDIEDPASLYLSFVVLAWIFPYGLYLRREIPKNTRKYLAWMGPDYLIKER